MWMYIDISAAMSVDIQRYQVLRCVWIYRHLIICTHCDICDDRD